jgi:hypothetical protein
MIIFVVSFWTCIRVIKESEALKKVANAELHYICRYSNLNGLAHTMSPLYLYKDPEKEFLYQIERAYKITQKIDAFHVHNEPNWMAVVLKKNYPKIPLIFDCHDLDLARTGQPGQPEVEALRLADGLIFPSEGYRDLVINQYGDALHTKNTPHAVVYSQCNQEIIEFISEVKKLRLPGIVYEGSMRSEDGSKYSYRNFAPLFGELTKEGINVFTYPSNPNVAYEYFQAGCSVMPTLFYIDLMMELTRYDWGFVGGPEPGGQLNGDMPNKLFEYITAGIPILAMNVPEVEAFIMKYGLGIGVKNVQEIKQVYGAHEEYRKNVLDLRSSFPMENQVEKIIKLYEEAAEECKDKISRPIMDTPILTEGDLSFLQAHESAQAL